MGTRDRCERTTAPDDDPFRGNLFDVESTSLCPSVGPSLTAHDLLGAMVQEPRRVGPIAALAQVDTELVFPVQEARECSSRFDWEPVGACTILPARATDSIPVATRVRRGLATHRVDIVSYGAARVSCFRWNDAIVAAVISEHLDPQCQDDWNQAIFCVEPAPNSAERLLSEWCAQAVSRHPRGYQANARVCALVHDATSCTTALASWNNISILDASVSKGKNLIDDSGWA